MRLGHRGGLDVRRTAIEPVDWEPWAGGRLATPMRLALDLLLGRALPDAVADLDAVLRAHLVERSAGDAGGRAESSLRVGRLSWPIRGRNGCRSPSSAFTSCSTALRLCRSTGSRTAAAASRARISPCRSTRSPFEYDGDWRDGQTWALNRDRDRLNRVHAVGWDAVFVTAPLLRDHRRLLRTVREAIPA
jgi:hypothetical protein